MTIGYFPKRIIVRNNDTNFILEAFQASFTQVKESSEPNMLDPRASSATVVGIENNKSLSSAMLRATTMMMGGLGGIITNLLNGNEGEDITISEENYILDVGARDYFKSFLTNFYVNFIEPLGIKRDENDPNFPKGKIGNLLLIEELISRIVVRVLCNEPGVRSNLLIDVLNTFLRKLEQATSEQKTQIYENHCE
ncbi:MAG: hypothetical protein [Circular genetic element sp.]|nr:MAG: hypothetical protein [Circular genetic element sp.]